MTCRYWRSDKEPEYKHEREYIIKLARRLEEAEEEYFMFVSFYIKREIDLLLFKRDGIFIIELKKIGGMLTAKENADWEIREKDGSATPLGRNFYRQVSGQYHALINFLKENKEKFLSPHKAPQINFNRIKSVICICPKLERSPEFEQHPFIDVIGFDELYELIWNEKQKEYDFSSDEITALSEALSLQEWQDIELVLSPMKTLDDFDWDSYLNSIVRNKKYQDLNNLYIHPKLSLEKYKKSFQSFEFDDLEKKLEESNNLLILAEPGVGKTSLLQKITYERAKRSLEKKEYQIPVFFPLIHFDMNNGGLLGLISYCFKEHGLTLSEKTLEDIYWMKKEFIFLFDGLNEIYENQKNQAIRQLKRFIVENERHKYVFTSRDIKDLERIDDSEIISINKFSEEDIYGFLKKFHFFKRGSKIDIEELHNKISANLFELLSNPMIAYIFSMILIEVKDFEFDSKSSIFQKFVRHTIERESEKKELENFPEETEIETFFSYLAYDLMEKSRFTISENLLDAKIHNIWSKLKKEERITCAESKIRNWLSKSIFLKRDRENRYFWHPQLQEFFAAKKLSELFAEEEKSAIDKLMDLRWNEVSVFAFDFSENAEDLLSFAIERENCHLLGKCLIGEGGIKAQEASKKIVEDLLRSAKDEKRLSGVKILGISRNTYYGLKRLLEVLSKEEEMLEAQYKKMGYSLWNEDWDSDISVNEIVFGSNVDKSLKKEDKLKLEKDFLVFNEIEQILMKMFWTKNKEYIRLIQEVDSFSITARGFLIEIIGAMTEKEEKNEILDFLESRLDEEVEPSIEVRSAAFGQIRDLFDTYPENKRLNSIWKRRENLKASEDFIGLFPGIFFKDEEDRADILFGIPNWLENIYENIKNSKIEDSAIETYLEVVRYISALLDKKKAFVDERKFVERIKKELQIRETGEDKKTYTIRVGPNKHYEIIFTIMNNIVLNGSVKSMEGLINLSYEKNLLIAIFAIVGFEMTRYIIAAHDAREQFEKIMEEQSNSVINRLLKEKKIKFLIILSQMFDFNFKSDSVDIGFNDLIHNLLDRIKNWSQLEDLMFEALYKKLIEESLVFRLLEYIGDEKTAGRLREDIKKLKIEDSEEVRILINRLLGKK